MFIKIFVVQKAGFLLLLLFFLSLLQQNFPQVGFNSFLPYSSRNS